MSFLHTLERFYGGFIRLLTALLTLTLLAVAVMALVNWQRATASEEPKEAAQIAAPKVSSIDLVKRVVASQSGQSVDPISSDPNRAAYERIEKTLHEFAQKHPSDDDVEVASVLSTAREKADDQDTAALKAAYASGLAAALEQTLSDSSIDALLKPSTDATPMGIALEAVNQYDTDFNEQLSMFDSHDSYRENDKARRDAWQSLARVGGPLLLLILVLQLLTFGRIEQNTRLVNRDK